MTDAEINAKLTAMDFEWATAFPVRGLEGTGKSVPYLGWFWRTVDFGKIWLGKNEQFVGFMESNKWDLPEWRPSPEQSAEIRRLLVAALDAPATERFQALFDYMQTLEPSVD